MDNPETWLEASLTCSGELAEAVAEVFSRYAPNGVLLHSVTSFDTENYEESPTGEMQVVAYLPVDEKIEQNRRQLDEAVWHLGQIAALSPIQYQIIADQDWMEAWKVRYQPLKLGQNLIVLPAWVDQELAGDRLPIIISPDMAFGTGTHPSTQLCLIALEKHGCQGKNVLDIGCGSGILSIAAVRLGADMVLGVDYDPIAIPSCQRNAGLNAMEGRILFEDGTHTDILERDDELKQAPVVLANILAHILIMMLATGLAETVSNSGILILGGILNTQADDVIQAAQTAGLTLIDTLTDQDWVVLVFQKA
ncbi:MAG TPA: 50S ribosomal protein L11 methyltransferase [Chloroflexi bacterium]|nr:50S ribosomal protein L11 methyltransferase [Anaerolineaceae bacterium]HHX08944.1 50S ribosomal protein L11 methyltransferase [Chloroflexota bacterium]